MTGQTRKVIKPGSQSEGRIMQVGEVAAWFIGTGTKHDLDIFRIYFHGSKGECKWTRKDLKEETVQIWPE